MRFEISSDTEVPGLSEVIGEGSSARVTSGELDRIAKSIEEHRIPVRATMGGVTDVLLGLIGRLRARELVEELEPTLQKLTWLECHVPPGGTTAVELEQTEKSASAWGFKIFGSGLGSGRDVRLAMVDKSEARNRCAVYTFDLVVQPRIFESGGVRSTEVTVVRVDGTAIEALETCPFCGVDRADLDLFEFAREKHLDLRKDDQSLSRTLKIEVERARKIDGGFEVPGMPVELSLQAETVSACRLTVSHEFKPGLLYQPYRRKSGGPLQTSMWATEI